MSPRRARSSSRPRAAPIVARRSRAWRSWPWSLPSRSRRRSAAATTAGTRAQSRLPRAAASTDEKPKESGSEDKGSGGSGRARRIAEATPAATSVDPVALDREGKALIDAGQPEQAIPILQQAVDYYPEDSQDINYAYSLYNLGHALLLAGRPDEAIPYLEKRLTFGDQMPTVQGTLDEARAAAGESDESEAIRMPTPTGRSRPGRRRRRTSGRVPTRDAARGVDAEASSPARPQTTCATISRSGSRSASSRMTIPSRGHPVGERGQRRVAAVGHALAVAGRPVDQEQADAFRAGARPTRSSTTARLTSSRDGARAKRTITSTTSARPSRSICERTSRAHSGSCSTAVSVPPRSARRRPITIDETPEPSSTTVRRSAKAISFRTVDEGSGPDRALGPGQVRPPVQERPQHLPRPGVELARSCCPGSSVALEIGLALLCEGHDALDEVLRAGPSRAAGLPRPRAGLRGRA